MLKMNKLEIERKFLVKIYDDFIYQESYDIEQYYINKNFRLRYMWNNKTNEDTYYINYKSDIDFVRKEYEKEISLDFFMCYLNTLKIEYMIYKKRFVIDRFELDMFLRYNQYGILEIELKNKNEKIPDIPKGIHIIKEVTNNKNYYNYYITKNGFPEIVEYPDFEYPYNLEKMRWYCNENGI